ncbi:MAG: hypothetical protein Q4B52_05390 [Tissierellia bacterium]|nr:hypothetical protein [Tissierellia bacterium]
MINFLFNIWKWGRTDVLYILISFIKGEVANPSDNDATSLAISGQNIIGVEMFKDLALTVFVVAMIVTLLQKIAFEGTTHQVAIKIAVGYMIAIGLIFNTEAIVSNTLKAGNELAKLTERALIEDSNITLPQDPFAEKQREEDLYNDFVEATLEGDEEAAKTASLNYIRNDYSWTEFLEFINLISPDMELYRTFKFDENLEKKAEIRANNRNLTGDQKEKYKKKYMKEQAKASYRSYIVDPDAEQKEGEDPPEISGIGAQFKYALTTAGIAVLELLVSIVYLVMTAMTLMLVVSRFIELILRSIGMPIALSLYCTQHGNSGSVRYLKSFIAICLQGSLIIIILALSSTFSTNLAAELLDGQNVFIKVIGDIAIKFAFIGLLMKSQQFAREIVGA